MLNILRKYWLPIVLAVVIILLIATVVFQFFKGLSHRKELKALHRAKLEQLDKKETKLKATIADHRQSMSEKDAIIDSFDNVVNLKDAQLENVHSEVQLLSGDSLAIVDALNRVFAK